ncbi:hypothetical protein RLIN73S_06011 [Rhodanobacter lindaniclasticus]
MVPADSIPGGGVRKLAKAGKAAWFRCCLTRCSPIKISELESGALHARRHDHRPPSSRQFVAVPPTVTGSFKRSLPKDAWRRAAVSRMLRRMFRKVGDQLCEPDGLPTTGIHGVCICTPNHRLGNSVLISPLIAEIETLYPGAEIDILGSHATACLYANRFSVHDVFALPQKIARHLWYSAGVLRAFAAMPLRPRHRRLRNGSQSGRIALAMAQAKVQAGVSGCAGESRLGLACAAVARTPGRPQRVPAAPGVCRDDRRRLSPAQSRPDRGRKAGGPPGN